MHHLGNRDKDLDQQIDILNKLDLEGMDICSEKNHSKMEELEFSKLISDRIIIMKPVEMGGAAVVLSTEHYKIVTMQHLDDASTYKKLIWI